MIKIIDAKRYWSSTIQVLWKRVEFISWAVLIWNWINFKAYIWIWTSWDETKDEEEVVNWWNSLPLKAAEWIFWDVKIKVWLEMISYRLRDKYEP